jgi:hypothetical protein
VKDPRSHEGLWVKILHPWTEIEKSSISPMKQNKNENKNINENQSILQKSDNSNRETVMVYFMSMVSYLFIEGVRDRKSDRQTNI